MCLSLLLSESVSCHSQESDCHYSCQWVLSFTRECLSLLLSVSVQLSFHERVLVTTLDLSVSVSCHSQESVCHYSCQWVFTCHSQESACHYSCQWVFSFHSQERVLVTTLVSECSAVIPKRVLVTIPQRFAVTGCMSCRVYSHIAHWEVSYDFCIIHHLGLAFLRVNNTWLACQVTPITAHCGFCLTVPSYRCAINGVSLVLTLLVEYAMGDLIIKYL